MLTKERIIRFDVNECSFDDLMIFYSELESIKAGYQTAALTGPPRWLAERIDEAKKEIEARTRADKKRRLRLLEAKQENLLPDDVKLKNVEDQIAELKKDLE